MLTTAVTDEQNTKSASEIATDDPWAEYRKRRRNYWLAFVALGPLWFVFGPLGVPVFAYGVCCVLILGGLSIRSMMCPCPRCGEPYRGGNLLFGNPYAWKCVNCGLRRWEPTESKESAP